MPNKRGPETPIEPDMALLIDVLPLPDPRKRAGCAAEVEKGPHPGARKHYPEPQSFLHEVRIGNPPRTFY